MIELPIPDFTRNYYKEHGVAFSDSEKATIIWNSALPRPEILDALREIAGTTTDEKLKAQIHQRLDAEAEIERAFCERDGRYCYIAGSMADSFEDAYIPLLDPFEPGDIVSLDGSPAVVELSPAEWEEDVKRSRSNRRRTLASYENTRLPVLCLCDDGCMCGSIWYILSLEKVESWDDSLEWNVLQAASQLIKGTGSLENFLYHYHRNLAQKEGRRLEQTP